METLVTVHQESAWSAAGIQGAMWPRIYLLDTDEDEEICRLIRSRTIDGERIILDKDLLLRRYVPKLTRSICQSSLYVYLEQELGLKTGMAKKIVRVQLVTREDRLYLDLHDDPVVAVISSFTRLEGGCTGN